MNVATQPPSPPPHPARWTLWAGRLVLAAWVAFWVWFNVAAGIGERSDPGSIDLAVHLGFGLGFLALGVIGWCWRRAGGIALLVATAALACWFRFGAAAILLAPPAVAGLLLIASDRLAARARSGARAA